MKKTLLLSALVVTATAFAGTTGKFTIDSKHTTTIETKKAEKTDEAKRVKLREELAGTAHEIKGAGEVVLGESGVTLGGDVTFEKKASTLKEANSFVKYDFTTNVEGLDAYIKGNVKTKSFENNANLTFTGEGQLSYKKDDMTYTLNSKTSTVLGSLNFVLDHEAKAEGKFDKVEDILVSANLHHGYPTHSDKNPTVKNEPMYLLTEAKGAVRVMDGLKIGAHNKFDMLFNGVDKDGNDFPVGKGALEIDKFIILDEKISFYYKGSLAETFRLYATYDKDNVEATGTGIVEYYKHNKKDDVKKLLTYGVKLDGKYKAIKNTELGANVLLGGLTQLDFDKKGNNFTHGVVQLGLNGKYDAKVNDKLTVTPKVEAVFTVDGIKAKEENGTSYSPALRLSVAPEVGVEFKATDSVTLTASSKATVNANREFEPVLKDETAKDKFGYKETKLEAKLGLKYTW